MIGMLTVYDKHTYEQLIVYDITYDTDGTPLFLLCIKDKLVLREANDFMLTPPWDRWRKAK